MGVRSRLPAGWSQVSEASAKFLPLSHLRGLKSCQKVAAVCYRLGYRGIEFLLVQTRNGRWTFPKGSAEPGLTHAQAAALEAFEEAGVHGRMEEAAFASYTRRVGRADRRSRARSAAKEQAINAHLCEVMQLDPPLEKDRNPTWFSALQAKRRLRDGRKPDYGAELARVVEHAAGRIRNSRGPNMGAETWQKDALHRVKFEAGEAGGIYGRMKQASLQVRRRRDALGNPAVEVVVNAYLGEVLRLPPPASQGRSRWIPPGKTRRLLTGQGEATIMPAGPQQNSQPMARVTKIDDAWKMKNEAKTPTTRE